MSSRQRSIARCSPRTYRTAPSFCGQTAQRRKCSGPSTSTRWQYRGRATGSCIGEIRHGLLAMTARPLRGLVPIQLQVPGEAGSAGHSGTTAMSAFRRLRALSLRSSGPVQQFHVTRRKVPPTIGAEFGQGRQTTPPREQHRKNRIARVKRRIQTASILSEEAVWRHGATMYSEVAPLLCTARQGRLTGSASWLGRRP